MQGTVLGTVKGKYTDVPSCCILTEAVICAPMKKWEEEQGSNNKVIIQRKDKINLFQKFRQ